MLLYSYKCCEKNLNDGQLQTLCNKITKIMNQDVIEMKNNNRKIEALWGKRNLNFCGKY